MKKFYSGEIYHIFNKSIASYGIFKDIKNCQRFIKTLDYYNSNLNKTSLSNAIRTKTCKFHNLLELKEKPLIKFISYCLMPDHYHLLLKVKINKSLSKYINDIENSYTRYFNIKYERKGPLWQTNFKRVIIRTDQQLLHVSRYIHLNPTTNNLVNNPADWIFSSYKDLINQNEYFNDIKELSIKNKNSYKQFVENQIDYQKKLKEIKNKILE